MNSVNAFDGPDPTKWATPGYCIIQILLKSGERHMWCLPSFAINPILNEETEMASWDILSDCIRISGSIVTDHHGITYWMYPDGKLIMCGYSVITSELEAINEEVE